MNSLLARTVCLVALVLAGCTLFSPPMGQAQLNAIETREVDAGYDDTFNAATGALFDAGYIISMSDRQGGLVTGSKAIDRSRQRALGHAGAEDTHFAMSIMVRRASADRSSVRIKTSVNGQPRVDRKATDEIWVLMQRQVLMTAPLATAPGNQ